MFQDKMREAIIEIMESLKSSDSDVRSTGISVLTQALKIGTWPQCYVLCCMVLNLHTATFQNEMRQAIPRIMECLKDADADVRMAAISLLTDILMNGA